MWALPVPQRPYNKDTQIGEGIVASEVADLPSQLSG